MSILDLDDLLNDLENAVEEEKERGKCTGARSCDGELGIAESNTYAQNNTSHLSPKVIGTSNTELDASNNHLLVKSTSASKNPNLASSSKQFSPVGSKMT